MKSGPNQKKLLSNLEAVQIQTIELCNRRCFFCPASERSARSYGKMQPRLFRKIIDQLLKYGFRGRVSPDLMSECLLDKRICGFLRDLRRAFPDNVLFINTNGDKLLANEAMLSNLIEAGIDSIKINCYDNRKQYGRLLGILKKASDAGRVRIYENIFSIKPLHIHDGIIRIALQKCFSVLPIYWNRGGNAPSVRPKKALRSCEYPSTQLYINYRGDCILCCSDWKYEVVFGNVNKTDIAQIWNSKRYRVYRSLHRSGRGWLLPLCNKCNRIASPTVR